MLVENADPKVDPVFEDRALNLVRRERVEVNMDLPGLGPEGSKDIGHWKAAFGGPVVDSGDGEVADQLAT